MRQPTESIKQIHIIDCARRIGEERDKDGRKKRPIHDEETRTADNGDDDERCGCDECVIPARDRLSERGRIRPRYRPRDAKRNTIPKPMRDRAVDRLVDHKRHKKGESDAKETELIKCDTAVSIAKRYHKSENATQNEHEQETPADLYP